MLQRGRLERVAAAKRYTAIWIADEAGWAIFADATLDDRLFCNVHSFDADIEVLSHSVLTGKLKVELPDVFAPPPKSWVRKPSRHV